MPTSGRGAVRGTGEGLLIMTPFCGRDHVERLLAPESGPPLGELHLLLGKRPADALCGAPGGPCPCPGLRCKLKVGGVGWGSELLPRNSQV